MDKLQTKNKMIMKQIDTYVESKRTEMIELWEELVNIESGPKQKEGVAKVISVIKSELEDIGLETKVLSMPNAGDVFTAFWKNTNKEKPIIFLGHTDTVFQPGVIKKFPFSIDDNGFAHGPGVLDMKGGLVIALYTIKALKEIDYTRYPIKLVLAGDEETMHKDSIAAEVLASEIRGAAAALNFETGYQDDGIVVGRKGGGIISLKIKGIAAHSGIEPEKGRSAILEAAYKIIELEKENDISVGKLLNCGMVNGGIGENTIPEECEIRIAYRFPTMKIKNEIVSAVDRIAKTSFIDGTTAKINLEMGMDCMETTPEVMALFEHFKQAALDSGYGSIHPFSVGGISDSAIAVVNGVPTLCGLGCKGKNNHTLNEYAEVESLFSRTKLAAAAVYQYP
ncbi:M20 family metallopeptidase [Enterococcus casseliflavus]|uniref:M20 family metallopeptidase n=1 Tax=Enterococcus TaxID=1350 RepID=UPI003D0D0DCB